MTKPHNSNTENFGDNNIPSKQRESNLELFRIISMLLIVAHHYVVNSGLTSLDGPIVSDPLSWRSLFLLLFGAWGKTGINCFVMITGYFMCTSHITAKKFAKLTFQWLFYRYSIYAIFLATGYTAFKFTGFVTTVLPITVIEQNFTACFVIFWLFIPFLNILISHMNEKQHICLLLLTGFTYIILGTVHRVTMNYVSWFMVLYLISSYIRLYPKAWFSNNKICGTLFFLLLAVGISSVVGCAWAGTKMNKFKPFFFVSDSNTFLAVAIGMSAFLFFKNLRIPYSRFINTVAASTFGVLLIHASGNTMRQWLWKDTVDCVGHYSAKFMPLYAFGCVAAIFATCICIDILRIQFLEKPFFRFWDKHWGRNAAKLSEKGRRFLTKMNVK